MWNHYDLTDYLRRESNPDNIKEICKKWPGSLLCEFHKEARAPGDQGDPGTTEAIQARLFRVIKRNDGNTSKGDFVVHLRLGDVVEDANYSVEEFLETQRYFYPRSVGKTWNAYVKPLQYYEKVAAQVSPGQSLVIVGATHKTRKVAKSCQYAYAVAAYLRQRGLHVKLRLGSDPDSDLMYLTNSGAFVSSGGGYSVFAGDMVKKNGGRVLEIEPPRK